MSSHHSGIHTILRSLDAAFAAFEAGNRGKLFDSRDSLVALSKEVKNGGWTDTVPLCDVIAKLLGRVLREGALDERAALAVVRDLLALVEGQVSQDPAAKVGSLVSDGVGGVFKVVNESRLGEQLVKMGKLHPAQVQQALVLQRVSKDKRFGEVLIAMNAIDQRTLEDALSAQQVDTKAKPGVAAPSQGLRMAPLPDLPGQPPAPLPSQRSGDLSQPWSQPPPLSAPTSSQRPSLPDDAV